MLLSEVNAFFLKYLLWVPPESELNVYRLVLWVFLSGPAVNEIYLWVNLEEELLRPENRIGAFAWLLAAAVFLETAVVAKFGLQLLTSPWPSIVVACWTSGTAAFCVVLGYW